MKREVDNEGWVLLPIMEASSMLGYKINASIPLIPSCHVLFNKETADRLMEIVLNDLFIPLSDHRTKGYRTTETSLDPGPSGPCKSDALGSQTI
jgi:hypothetical protein